MKTLNKLLGIGLITLASLTGCMKFYIVDGKQVKYNKNIGVSMIVNEGDSLVKYFTPYKGSEGPKGKDLIMTTAYYKDGSMNISDKTSAGFSDKVTRYDYLLNRIDSLENKE